ncbi:sterol desaturase family protein [Saccharospirillum mangrovi]|uniref:sterol desaturase family protein n=1 Tax=Saccharospirillum mangrovi TaxID=2161747 RepID=UPI000D35BEF4|nr:sterol desaturase family protein [Saccharospirillum mangrovi]
MNLILYAIPGFVVLLLLEIAVDAWRRTGYYRANDAIASLSTGMLNQTLGFATQFLRFLGYATLWALLPHAELTMSPALWVLAFVLYDLCYYWSHRCQHQINFLWGIHVVHHQSEEFNLSTALRQPFNDFWIGSVFYLPMLFLGFPPEVIVVVGSLNLIYQFWVHTRFIGRLGWLERVLVTPMNHRVHHAINDPYIDRNFGGVFILWDRLFGSYQAELDSEPCVYGLRKPLQSWNPFFANLQVHRQLLKDAWHTRRWIDKCRLWWMPTGWRPADVAERFPLPRCLPDTQVKFDAPPARRVQAVVIANHAWLMGLTVWFLINTSDLTFTAALLHFLPLGGGLWLNSRVLEQRSGAVVQTAVFWLLCASLPWLVPSLRFPTEVFTALALLSALSFGWAARSPQPLAVSH